MKEPALRAHVALLVAAWVLVMTGLPPPAVAGLSADPLRSLLQAPTSGPLAERETVPGRLRVRVFERAVPMAGRPAAAWLYSTDGFRRLGRSELVLFVLRRPDERAESYPEDPLRLMTALFEKAAGQEALGEGDALEVALGRFLGRDDVLGATFARLDPLRPRTVQPDALLVVLLVGDEVDVVRRFGALRVLGHLGAHHRAFPWPVYFDRDRPAVVPAPGWWDSVLARATVHRIAGVRVWAELPVSFSRSLGPGNLVVSLSGASRSALADAVAGARVALLAELDPETDTLAAYDPRRKALVPLRSREGPTERLTGTFVAFLPGEEDVARQSEDGFVVELTAASRDALLQALREGRDLQLLGSPSSLTIRVRWRD